MRGSDFVDKELYLSPRFNLGIALFFSAQYTITDLDKHAKHDELSKLSRVYMEYHCTRTQYSLYIYLPLFKLSLLLYNVPLPCSSLSNVYKFKKFWREV